MRSIFIGVTQQNIRFGRICLVIRLGARCESRQNKLEGITGRTGNQCFSQLREGINVTLQCCLVASNQMKGEPYLLSQDFRLCEHTHVYMNVWIFVRIFAYIHGCICVLEGKLTWAYYEELVLRSNETCNFEQNRKRIIQSTSYYSWITDVLLSGSLSSR